MKTKKCKVCRNEFEPTKPLAVVCSLECALSLASLKKAKRERAKVIEDRKETKAKLEKLKTRQEWEREAQTEFNKYIRLRDINEPCISCGRHHQGQYHAGHYLSRGARPELAFDEDNCHKQCSVCNNHLSGNAVLYRIGLLKKIGLERVERLECYVGIAKRSIDALRAIKAHYKAKCKEMEKQQ